MSHTEHQKQKGYEMLKLSKTAQPITQGYIRFEDDEKFKGLASNKQLLDIAKRATQVRDQVEYLKTSNTLSEGAVTVGVHNLITKQKQEIQKLSTKALDGIEARVIAANKKLFSNNNEVGVQEAPLTPEILRAFNSPKAETREMVANPNSARHLVALSKLGLVPDGIRESINKKHTPEATQELGSAESDLNDLGKIEKEFNSFALVNDDPATAQRLMELSPKEFEAIE